MALSTLKILMLPSYTMQSYSYITSPITEVKKGLLYFYLLLAAQMQNSQTRNTFSTIKITLFPQPIKCFFNVDNDLFYSAVILIVCGKN